MLLACSGSPPKKQDSVALISDEVEAERVPIGGVTPWRLREGDSPLLGARRLLASPLDEVGVFASPLDELGEFASPLDEVGGGGEAMCGMATPI